MGPLSYVIVGSGYRAMLYVRIALHYPQCFRLKYFLCRTEEKAERIRREYGVPVTLDPQACRDARPDFVVVAVDRGSNFSVIKEWLTAGFPVLAETPGGTEEQQLDQLWELRQRGAKLLSAEQYIRYPLIAAGLRAVDAGLLGDPYAVALSLAHDYHGASLIRRMLRCGLKDGRGRLPAMTLRGKAFTYPVEETDSRYGPITDGSVTERTRTVVTVEFDNGKAAFYDFDPVQYRSFIRSRHINVRGQTGEWNDTVLRYVGEGHRPVRQELKAWLDPAYEMLHTPALRQLCGTWQPEVHMEPIQDEFAVASLMLDMGRLIGTGEETYPLAEALEDAYTWILFERAAAHPGQTVVSQRHPWQDVCF